MFADQYVTACQSCTQSSVIGEVEVMELHQKQTKREHKFVKVGRLEDKIKILSQKVTETTISLERMIRVINRKGEEFIKAISKIRDELVVSLQREIVMYWFDNNPISNNVRTALAAMQLLRKGRFSQFTCQQMDQFLQSAKKVKDKEFVKKQKPKVDKKLDQLIGKFQSQLKTELNAFLADIKQKEEKMNFSIDHNQPTITTIQGQPQSFFSKESNFSILEMLETQEKSSKISNSSEDAEMKKKKWKKAKDNISEVSYKEEPSKSIISRLDKLKPQAKKQSIKRQERPHRVERDQSTNSLLSSFLRSEYFEQESHSKRSTVDQKPVQNKRYEPESQSETSEEDESRLNQTILQFQRQILDNDQTCFASASQVVFTTMNNLQKYKKQEALFNVKVSIVKVLYYSVLESHIPKTKFIAGDHTGYGVFYTNYCPGMKVDTQLEMRDCTFRGYKGSDQIINKSNFRIMREYQPKIKVNLKGHKINKAIITHDLYYPLEDKLCTLVRQVAEILKSGQYYNYFIKRMTVKVVTVINDSVNSVFCLVGDSSGMMMAYLKKDRVKNIKDSDVVRLLNVWGIRAKPKNGEFDQEIIYLDSLQASGRVLQHSFDFLQIDGKMMTPA